MTKEKIDVYLNRPGTEVKKYRFEHERPDKFRPDVPCVTVSRQGFYLNVKCLPYLQRKPYAHILYDKKEKAVAIKPVHKRSELAYTINNLKNNRANPLFWHALLS